MNERVEAALAKVDALMLERDEKAQSVHHQEYMVSLAQMVLQKALLVEIAGLREDLAKRGGDA